MWGNISYIYSLGCYKLIMSNISIFFISDEQFHIPLNVVFFINGKKFIIIIIVIICSFCLSVRL